MKEAHQDLFCDGSIFQAHNQTNGSVEFYPGRMSIEF
jgi:hypothetical protein